MPTDPLGWLIRALVLGLLVLVLGRAWARLVPAHASLAPLWVGNTLLVGSALFAWRASSSLATPDDNPRSVVLAALAVVAFGVWRGQRQGWGRRLSGGLGVARDATLGAWLAMADAVDAFAFFVLSGSGAILTVAGATALVLALGYLITALALAWHGQPFWAEATATALAGLAASVLTWAGYTRLGQPTKPARTPFGGPTPQPKSHPNTSTPKPILTPFGGPTPLPQPRRGTYSATANQGTISTSASGSTARPYFIQAGSPQGAAQAWASHYTQQPPGGPMPRPGLTVDQYAILRMPGQAWAFRVSEVRSYQPTQSFSTSSGTHVATFPLGPVEITVTGYDPVAVDLAEVDAFAQAAHIRQGGRPTPKPAPPPPPAQAPDPPPDPDPVPSRPVRIPRDMPVSYALLADLAEDDRLALNLLWLSWPLVRPYWPADRAGFGRRRYGLALRLTKEYGLTGAAATWALDTWEACL